MLPSVIGGPGEGDTFPAWRLRSSKMRAESHKQKPAQAEWTGLLPTKQLVPDVEPILLVPPCIAGVLHRVSLALQRRGISY